MSVPHALSSSPVVRRRLRNALLECDISGSVVDDTALLVAELVGNALRHADPLPDGSILISWDIGPSAVVVSVTDGGASTSPGLRAMHAFETSGRGLPIVESLALEWGIRRRDGATTVWATLALTPAAEHSPEKNGSRSYRPVDVSFADARPAARAARN